MIPGVKVSMSGADWTIPPLTLGSLRRLLPQVQKMTAGTPMSEEQIDTLVEVVHAAMTRNYPDLTQERVLDLLDVGNASAVMGAVLNASGLRAAGEAAPVARSNGAGSMALSPPAADTASPPSTE